MLQAFLHGKSIHDDGSFHSLWTKEVKVIRKPLGFVRLPVTGYGKNIPTDYMVKFNGRLRRVYCMQYSNSGTTYIKAAKGEFIGGSNQHRLNTYQTRL